MTPLDYVLDSALVLLVLMQIKEREFTLKSLIRPLVVVSIAVATYLHGIPTAGNDLVLIGALAITGGVIGALSGGTLLMRAGSQGAVLVRAGWASAICWVLGMGSRFAFAFWSSHGGAHDVARFSVQHAITSGDAWTAALLAMAVCEVLGRSAVIVMRRQQMPMAPTAPVPA